MDGKESDSWMWKNILRLRANARKHIFYKIGSGQKTSVWYDWWNGNGPLCDIICNNKILEAGFSLEHTVSDMIINGSWTWPVSWLPEFPMLQDVSVPILNSEEDKDVWKTNGDKKVQFNIKSAWEDFRDNGDKVQCHKLVWFSQGVPSHMFIVWMAVNERLQTQDRIMKWNNDINMRCPLCKSCPDSHDHIFFQCQFSQIVWNEFQNKEALRKRPLTWKDTISALTTWFPNKSVNSIVGKLVFGAMVYYLWQERNKRLFTQERRSEKNIIDIITDSVRMRLMGLQVIKTNQVIKVFHRWNVQPTFVNKKP